MPVLATCGLALTLSLGALGAGDRGDAAVRSASGELKALRGVTRVLFLGDSITYAGGYIDAIDEYLFRQFPDRRYELIDAGLPSETVSGLSEPNHAGGAFPRPDLAERLDRALARTRPQLVVACYGMNDGIYYPFAEDRFSKYRAGILRLRSAVRRAGARLWLVTPPPFDPLPIAQRLVPIGASPYPPGGMSADYDGVLERYSRWLLSRRSSGWNVVDVHGPIAAYVAAQRRSDPGFTLAADGVHLNEVGHRLMAREILRAWGAPEDALPPIDRPATDDAEGREVSALVHERQRILTEAWLTAIGHRRPGMARGMALPEATAKAEELETRIRSLLIGGR